MGEERTKSTPDQNLPTGHAIGKGDGGPSPDGRNDGVDQVHQQLHGAGGVAQGVVDGGVKVTQTVTRPLTEDGDHHDLEETPATAVGEEEWAV